MQNKKPTFSQQSFANAINDALATAMSIDPLMIAYGLGISDPKAIFGTTENLTKKFGAKRVFDMPTSENAMTGVAIGAAIAGIRSVATHQRLDFFLLAMDQLVNSAAKWNYTYGVPVPITIRLIIGRGWGQGPTHSQNLHAWFAHIPGLKVVVPTTPSDAKGLLLSSIFDPNPVVFIEHRWLHNSVGDVPSGDYRLPIGKAELLQEGSDVTVLAMSYLTAEARRAADYLLNHDISCDLLDLRSLKPIDWVAIKKSVKKTGRLLVLDTGYTTGSVAGEIIAKISMECFKDLKAAPIRLAMPDVPEPSSFGLTKGFFISANHIVGAILELLEVNSADILFGSPAEQIPHDVPGSWFKGPF
jgi:pyruvate dehydrogenase E1 component beta subunit